ncbi:hypothetical protein CN981_08755 [Priestia megaterium]|nr:hypothetical protein CN981_08755 [Priestia megaterium]
MFTKRELLRFNDLMLGRRPSSGKEGIIGYNKGDLGACRTYYYGLSNAQYADLARRLVKYTNTQLKVSTEEMEETADHFRELSKGKDRSDGVSISINRDGTLISFRYNYEFISEMNKQPFRQYDPETSCWAIPNDQVFNVLEALKSVGADVENSIEYAKEKLKWQR